MPPGCGTQEGCRMQGCLRDVGHRRDAGCRDASGMRDTGGTQDAGMWDTGGMQGCQPGCWRDAGCRRDKGTLCRDAGGKQDAGMLCWDAGAMRDAARRARTQAGCVPGHEHAVQGHAPAVPQAAGEGTPEISASPSGGSSSPQPAAPRWHVTGRDRAATSENQPQFCRQALRFSVTPGRADSAAGSGAGAGLQGSRAGCPSMGMGTGRVGGAWG